MPQSPLEVAGAQVDPTSAAPLHTNEFFTGMWTQGNPLGPGAVPYLYQKFYAATRYDRLVGGQNLEVTSKLTLGRRPGHSVYNAGPFPPINRFYEFRAFQNNVEQIHIMASCDEPANLLANPRFLDGATGYGFQGVWALGSGGVPSDINGTSFTIGPAAVYTGPGTAAVVNNTHVACVAGDTIYASCWALGEVGATGSAVLRVTFYDAGGSQLGTTNSAAVPNNFIWTRPELVLTAPSSTAYAICDFAVFSSTGSGPRWFAVWFYASLSDPVPTVRDVTGPSTNLELWQKNSMAARTGFQSVGNVLYFSDGVDAKKWVLSAEIWRQGTLYDHDHFITDSNNNLQLATGAQTANIANIMVEAYTLSGGGSGKKVTIFLSALTPIDVLDNISFTLAGLTTVTSLNGATPYTAVVVSSTQISFSGVFFGVPVTAYSAETGTVSTGGAITGATQPSWNTSYGLVTQDGSQQWVNLGSAVQNWGFAGPANPPTVTQVPAATLLPSWAANTWYAPLFVIFDAHGNMQQLTTAGTTGGAPPAWAFSGTTSDGSCVWTFKGSGAWTASATHAVGDLIQVNYDYYITTTFFDHATKQWITQTVSVNVTSLFRCTVAGISGANPPSWVNGLLTTTLDGSVTWTNQGTAPAWPGATQTLSLATSILDSLGNIQSVQSMAESGATAPTWQSANGATTREGTGLSWINTGPYSAPSTAAWIWAYSGKNSISGHISTASPVSQPLVVSSGNLAVIQGTGPTDPQEDTIVLWRTVQGGSLLLYDDEFPNPGAGQAWVYTDTTQDPSSATSPQAGQLNFLISAPISSTNNPPPAGFIPQAYYLGRIWGYVGNILIWSGGPATNTGSGNESFPPSNRTTFPSTGVTCWASSIGLICYTNSDVWVVLGQGTDNSPFYVINFQTGVGLGSQDAFCVNGSTAYGILTSGQVVSMDPGAGELEIGFPIGDQFDSLYTPSEAYCAWHQGSSADMALYVADGALGWFRMAPVAAPETGNVWSNRALIQGGVQAIASLEVMPGQRRLLLGPANRGPILMRDLTAKSDNGTPYDAYADIGVIPIAQPGGTAAVQFVVTEERTIAGATPAYVEARFDEIDTVAFRTLRNSSNDPPNLPVSLSVTVGRWWALQDPGTIPICRYVQLRLGWPAEAYANELLTYTIYGRLPQKARR